MQKLFALDIGTRSVVGIILEHKDDQFHVADILVKEHKERAMVDGQIHNVVLVADLIKEIKSELEQVHGPLTKVSVAAAGRSLKTEQASAKVDIKNRPIFTEEDISRLELQAVQQAQQQLLQNKDDMTMTHYYCVGYSVLFYRLDGEEIGSLVDQQGHEAEVEVIATFLPRVVVESLLAALKRADLEMDALTLEPIAAINVLIPPTMRRLNVALVDIGAGTSDIAITDQGTVVAYGMVPTAGDEITEALSDHYLLDFPIADQTKRKLQTEDEILIQDILGFDQYFPRNDVIDAIQPAIEHLASAISNEILRLNNQKTPKAVMLVGGGSLTPRITTEIGKVLNLTENRVAVRGIDAIQNLTKADSIPVTPELVTPIGIAIAAKKSPVQYISVTVNEQVVRLFELKEMTVSDAFLAANIRAKQLYGKPGQALSITVNHQSIFIPGEHGVPSTIYVNGEAASTKTPIKSGDIISLEIGRDGKKAEAQVKDLIDPALTKEISINGQSYTLLPKIYVNNKLATDEQYLQDRDDVTIKIAETVEQVLEACNYSHISKNTQSYQIVLDNKPIHLPQFSTEIQLNGTVTKLTFPVKNGDKITFEQSIVPTAKNVANELHIPLDNRIVVTFQGELVELNSDSTEVSINGQAATVDSIIKNGATVKYSVKNDEKWIFQDIFRFSDWQIPSNFKGQFLILRNGEEAGFDTQIFGGDVLKIELIPSEQTQSL
jgi:cell division protein FtsA